MGRRRTTASRRGPRAARYQVVRVIRMFVEFWDRTRLGEQEALIGRRRPAARRSTASSRDRHPRLRRRSRRRRSRRSTPTSAWPTRARPRPPTSRILRKGFSFSRGFDGAGQLDQGLAFVSFQRSIERQFLPMQDRLAGEPLEEYILPDGGGFFFALPGVADEDGFLGEGLLA